MKIVFLFSNRTKKEIIGVQRVSNISRDVNDCNHFKCGLYYETCNDFRGHGHFVDMSDVICFEVQS